MSAALDVDVVAAGPVVLQIAVADLPGTSYTEDLVITLDGKALTPRVVHGVTGTRLHVVEPDPGKLYISYRATVDGEAEQAPVDEAELLEYLRPSRYAESDKLASVAAREFGHLTANEELLAAVSSWVSTRLTYVPGSSDPIDGAVDTYLLGQGVCRDYAHLVVALLRARQIPARLVAVYAPGLDPMDFHAVAEAYIQGQWRVVDGTLLAPRSSLVRISTGRDAADTAFLDNHDGGITFNSAIVSAIVDGTLPNDDPRELVSLT
ncbi:transglutaminase family protein [Nakamurella flavida]